MLLRQVVKKSAFAENVISASLCGHGFQVTGGENFVVSNVNKSSKPGSCSAGNFKLSSNPLREGADV
jgi:hypothetical protein